MSPTDPAPADPQREVSRAASAEAYTTDIAAFGKLVERITPWLLDLGSWIFGGLIGFNLLILAALIPIRPVDPTIKVSMTAFALALPLNVTGFVLLKLVQDMERVGVDEVVAQAFEEVGFSAAERVPDIKDPEALHKRRTRSVLGYGLGILALSAVLTVTGVSAVLWETAWWIGIAFLAMVVISIGMALAVTRQVLPRE